jgi:hypothetical protein
MSEQKDPELNRLIGAGATLTGAAVGALVAGPIVAVGGAAVGWVTEQFAMVGAELARRHLAPRAEARVGAVYVMAGEQVRARLLSGEEPDERLREEVSPGRSAGEELLEAMLKTAADTHQERKLPYEANLLQSLVFEKTLSHATKNQLITVADQLSWRQLVLLAVYEELGAPPPEEIPDVVGEWDGESEEGAELVAVRVDLLDLFRRGLLSVPPRYQHVVRAVPLRGSFEGVPLGGSKPAQVKNAFVREQLPWPAVPGEINARGMWLSEDGRHLADLMRLQDIPTEDREALVLAILWVASVEPT